MLVRAGLATAVLLVAVEALAAETTDGIVEEATAAMDKVVTAFERHVVGETDADVIDDRYQNARDALRDIRNDAKGSLTDLGPEAATPQEIAAAKGEVQERWKAYQTTLDSLYEAALAPSPTTTTTAATTTTTRPSPAPSEVDTAPNTKTASTTPMKTPTTPVTVEDTDPSRLLEVAPALGSLDPALDYLPLPRASEGTIASIIDRLETVFPPAVVVAIVAPLTLVEAVTKALLDGGRQIVLPGLATGSLFAWVLTRRSDDPDGSEPLIPDGRGAGPG